MKVFSNGPFKTWDGQDFKTPMGDDKTSTEFRDLLSFVMNNVPTETLHDTRQCLGLAKSINAAEGQMIIEMDDEVVRWIRDSAEKHGGYFLRQNLPGFLTHMDDGALSKSAAKKLVIGKETGSDEA